MSALPSGVSQVFTPLQAALGQLDLWDVESRWAPHARRIMVICSPLSGYSGTVELTLPSQKSARSGRFRDSLLPKFAVFCGTWDVQRGARKQSLNHENGGREEVKGRAGGGLVPPMTAEQQYSDGKTLLTDPEFWNGPGQRVPNIGYPIPYAKDKRRAITSFKIKRYPLATAYEELSTHGPSSPFHDHDLKKSAS